MVSHGHEVAGNFDPLAYIFDGLPTLDLIELLNLVELAIRKQDCNFGILAFPKVRFTRSVEIIGAAILALVAGAELHAQSDAVLERHLKSLAVTNLEHTGPFGVD